MHLFDQDSTQTMSNKDYGFLITPIALQIHFNIRKSIEDGNQEGTHTERRLESFERNLVA